MLDHALKESALFAREPLRIGQRTNDNVSIQQESRIQIVESSILLDTIPWDMGMHDIFGNFEFPLQDTHR